MYSICTDKCCPNTIYCLYIKEYRCDTLAQHNDDEAEEVADEEESDREYGGQDLVDSPFSFSDEVTNNEPDVQSHHSSGIKQD